MTSFPATFPTVGIQSSRFGLKTASSVSQSPFSFAQQVYNFTGQMWHGSVTFPPCTNAQAARIKGFLASLLGQYGTFLYGDPDFLAKGVLGTNGGTPLVKGDSQTGKSLTTDGWTALQTVLKAGDYFQLGTGANARLYMLTTDAASDTGGNATLVFEPSLRSSPADNAVITTTGAKGLFRLASNNVEWDSNHASIYGFTIDFMEAVGE